MVEGTRWSGGERLTDSAFAQESDRKGGGGRLTTVAGRAALGQREPPLRLARKGVRLVQLTLARRSGPEAHDVHGWARLLRPGRPRRRDSSSC